MLSDSYNAPPLAPMRVRAGRSRVQFWFLFFLPRAGAIPFAPPGNSLERQPLADQTVQTLDRIVMQSISEARARCAGGANSCRKAGGFCGAQKGGVAPECVFGSRGRDSICLESPSLIAHAAESSHRDLSTPCQAKLAATLSLSLSCFFCRQTTHALCEERK